MESFHKEKNESLKVFHPENSHFEGKKFNVKNYVCLQGKNPDIYL